MQQGRGNNIYHLSNLINMNQAKNNWQNLADRLNYLINLLELDSQSGLYKDVTVLSYFLAKSSFQIAVFAPFNHGKSTLLNALLGQKSLPIDLIPSTGAAITIKYGETTKAEITLQDGTKETATNTKILQEYAILDSDRNMRKDIKAVEISCNYPLLKNNVELLDLPGTNDREAQDNLVKDKLLTADLIIHVLDARKLMTLLEREKLRDWLQDRGIHTVVFVVNFLNLLEPEDQKKVYSRLKFVAESFRSELPPGISNLYRVDALPALRARLKGEYVTVMETGLINFETALQNIIKANSKQPETKLTRIKNIADKLIQKATEKRDSIEQKINNTIAKKQKEKAIKQKAAILIKQGLQRSISEFESWLYLPNLLRKEQSKLAIALQQKEFKNWKKEFNQTVSKYQQSIIEWLTKGQDFFAIEKSAKLLISFPEPPEIKQQNTLYEEKNNSYEPIFTEDIERILNQTVKNILSDHGKDFLTKLTNKNYSYSTDNNIETKASKSYMYAEAAEAYLTSFSQQAFIRIKQYHLQIETLIDRYPQSTIEPNTKEQYQVKLLNNAITNLQQELNSIAN